MNTWFPSSRCGNRTHLKTMALALSLVAASAAHADGRWGGHHHGGWGGHHGYRYSVGTYYAPPAVVYQPPVVVYRAPPVVYSQPAYVASTYYAPTYAYQAYPSYGYSSYGYSGGYDYYDRGANRAASSAVMGVAGGLLGAGLSHGDPAATIFGAITGLAVGASIGR